MRTAQAAANQVSHSAPPIHPNPYLESEWMSGFISIPALASLPALCQVWSAHPHPDSEPGSIFSACLQWAKPKALGPNSKRTLPYLESRSRSDFCSLEQCVLHLPLLPSVSSSGFLSLIQSSALSRTSPHFCLHFFPFPPTSSLASSFMSFSLSCLDDSLHSASPCLELSHYSCTVATHPIFFQMPLPISLLPWS